MIRKATQQDISGLYQVYKTVALDWDRLADKKYKRKIQTAGYLFGIESEQELAKELNSALFGLVYNDDNHLKGYVLLNQETYFPEDAPNAIWIKPETKNDFFQKNRMATLYYVAVNPAYRREHIGTKLIREAEQRLIKQGVKCVYLIIQIHPIINAASVSFHAKLDYEAVCITSPIDMRFKNYMSMLMYKQLS